MGLLLWVFSSVELGAFRAALAHGAFRWFVPGALCVMGLIYLADCLAISKTFTWFSTPLRYRDVMPIRGASYLLSIINYNLGQGAIILFVRRSAGISLALATGTVLFIMGINLLVLLSLAAAALSLADVPRAAALWPWIAAMGAGVLVYALGVTMRPRWLTKRPLLKPVFAAKLKGHLKAMAVRVPHLTAIFVTHYLAMRAFGVHPPLTIFLAYMPIVSLLSALPISPQGIGTQQVATVFFFSPYAQGPDPKATVLAYSVSLSALVILFMLVMGLGWLRRALSMLGLRAAPGTPDARDDDSGDAPGPSD